MAKENMEGMGHIDFSYELWQTVKTTVFSLCGICAGRLQFDNIEIKVRYLIDKMVVVMQLRPLWTRVEGKFKKKERQYFYG